MTKSDQSRTGDRPRGTLRHTNAFGKIPTGCDSGLSLCTQSAQTSNVTLGSKRGLNDDADRQYFVEVSWCVAGPNLCSMDAQTTWDCFAA